MIKTVTRFRIRRIDGDVIVDGLVDGDLNQIEYAHPSVCNEELACLTSMIADDAARGLSFGRLTRDLEWFEPSQQQPIATAEALMPDAVVARRQRPA